MKTITMSDSYSCSNEVDLKRKHGFVELKSESSIKSFFAYKNRELDRDSLLIGCLRNSVLDWKLRLRTMIDSGSSNLENNVNHISSDLGKWLYGGVLMEYGCIAGMNQMEKLHVDMYCEIDKAVKNCMKGNLSEAEKNYSYVVSSIEMIVRLLGKISLDIRQIKEYESARKTSL